MLSSPMRNIVSARNFTYPIIIKHMMCSFLLRLIYKEELCQQWNDHCFLSRLNTGGSRNFNPYRISATAATTTNEVGISHTGQLSSLCNTSHVHRLLETGQTV